MFQLEIIGGMIGKGVVGIERGNSVGNGSRQTAVWVRQNSSCPFSGMKPYRLGNPIRSRAPFCVFSSAG